MRFGGLGDVEKSQQGGGGGKHVGRRHIALNHEDAVQWVVADPRAQAVPYTHVTLQPNLPG